MLRTFRDWCRAANPNKGQQKRLRIENPMKSSGPDIVRMWCKIEAVAGEFYEKSGKLINSAVGGDRYAS